MKDVVPSFPRTLRSFPRTRASGARTGSRESSPAGFREAAAASNTEVRAAGADDGRPAEDRGGAFASVLRGCRPLFPAALIDSAGWERLLARARSLPRSVTDAPFGFEFHLGEASRDADLFVVAPPGSDLSRHYVREGARAEEGSAAAALGSAFRMQAEDAASYLARSVAGTVLEYDLSGLAPGGTPPAPGVFLAPRASAPGSREGFVEHPDPAGLLAALAGMVGRSGWEEVLPEVERVFAALPETGYVFQGGALPGRSPGAFRILIKGVAGEEVPALLERLEWPGPIDAAADALASVDDLVAYVAVSMDVAAQGLGPRLGLELYRPPKWFAVDRTGWIPFIARLEDKGWCLPSKAAGLRSWPGTERLFDRGELRLVRKGVNHVKVVVERGVPTAVKAYAGMDAHPYGPKRGRGPRARSDDAGGTGILCGP